MPNCNLNRKIAKLVGQKKIDELTQVYFTIMNDIDACAKIITSRYNEFTGSVGAFRPTSVPPDLINICDSIGCKNSGTLYVSTETTGAEQDKTHTAGAKFTSISDATEYFGGVIYYYLNLPKAGTYTVTTTISDASDSEQTNGDKYETTITSANGGWTAVTIDLAQAPSEDLGTGWVATTNGITIAIEASYTDQEQEGGLIGISSISMFDSLEDLEGNNVVVLGCLTGIEGTDSISALESACEQAQYDETSTEVTRSITARQWSPNVMMLNPMIRKGERTRGGFMVTVEKEIVEDGEYGSVHLSDIYEEECGYIYVSMKDSCNIYDSLMTRLNNPNLLAIDERQYQVIDNKVNPNTDIVGAKLYFNKNLIGEKVMVSYMRETDVDSYVANIREVNQKRAKMYYPKYDTDGTMHAYNYRNVLITSFPMTLSNTDAEFTFEVSVQRDLDGTYYSDDVINKAGYTL